MEWPIAINDVKKELEALRALISSGSSSGGGLPEVRISTPIPADERANLTDDEMAQFKKIGVSPCIIYWIDSETRRRAAIFSCDSDDVGEMVTYMHVDENNVSTGIYLDLNSDHSHGYMRETRPEM